MRKYTEQEQQRESIIQAIEKIEDKKRSEFVERFARKLANGGVE
ncbi:MAG: hypothetical protein ACLTV0_12005 [Faecalimonas sp.]